uniref:Uncharacterized protein n=1 Tax=Sphaerodactylus townsendi TaxID=933632 RepID=A0ACB8E9G4_9SAUR
MARITFLLLFLFQPAAPRSQGSRVHHSLPLSWSLHCFHSDCYAVMVDVLLNDVTTNQTLIIHAHSACSAVCKGLLCSIDPAAMTFVHLFLLILLVLLMRLDGALGPCPPPCHCTLEILNCSRINNHPRVHQIPLPKPAVHPHLFMYLDFTGNLISSIGKEAWKDYPWAEYLVLMGNNLSRLENSSLQGLLFLTYLDLSCNKIQVIEKNVFDPAPFLQIINLSGNVIEQITYGTFQAWHGMQFLFKLDLSHNPLAVIQDSSFYNLPSLKLLDLGTTKITPKILEDLLLTSLQLRMLILPQNIFCCLCHFKDDIEVCCKIIKLECTDSCGISVSQCENEEPLIKVQEVIKVLETRKMSSSSLLTILLERAIPNIDTLTLAQNYSSLAANVSLLKSVLQLMQLKADEPLDINWVDKHKLKKLYLMVNQLQAAAKKQILELGKDSPEVAFQTELAAQVSKKSAQNTVIESAYMAHKKGRHSMKVTKENWLGIHQRSKATLFRHSRDGQEVAKATTPYADQSSVFDLYNDAQSQRQLAEHPDPQHPRSSLRSSQAALQSSWKHFISDSPRNAVNMTDSIIVGNKYNDLTSLSSGRNSVAALGDRLGAKIFTKEELLYQLLHRSNFPSRNGKSEIAAADSEPSRNELLRDITLSHGTHWEHQRNSVSTALNFLAHQDYLLQGDLFEAKLNKQLTSLIPDAPVRKFISRVVRILKIDCTVPTVQGACAKLIFRTGLLIKFFTDNIKETSFLWKKYFWLSKNIANTTTGNSRKQEKPLDVIASQGIIDYEYGNKLLLAFSVTAIIMIIISVICLIEIFSQYSAAKDRAFLGRRNKPLPDLEYSRTGSLMMDKPLWIKDMCQIHDETQKNMADKQHEEEFSEEVDRVSRGNTRPSLPESPMKKASSKTLPTIELLHATTAALPPPPPSSTPSPKPSVKKASDTAGVSSEITSSKAVSSEVGEGGDEDKEVSAEKPENPTSESTSEAAESGEREEKD